MAAAALNKVFRSYTDDLDRCPAPLPACSGVCVCVCARACVCVSVCGRTKAQEFLARERLVRGET